MADSQLCGKLCCSKEGSSQFWPAACSLFRVCRVWWYACFGRSSRWRSS